MPVGYINFIVDFDGDTGINGGTHSLRLTSNAGHKF